MSDKITRMLSTFFYVGEFPIAPGTAASIVGVFIYIIFHTLPIIYIGLLIIITLIGFAVSGDMERITNKKDPGCVVIDEVSGVMISFLFLPLTWPVIITAFFLFRAFDMFKIYPVNKFEELEGGYGIMLDDVIAGIYTNITMHIAIRLAGVI